MADGDPLSTLRAAFVLALLGKERGAPTPDPWASARRVVDKASSPEALRRLHEALTRESPDPIHGFFQRDPVFAGDASWRRRTDLLNRIEEAAGLPRSLPPDPAALRPDRLAHLDAEPDGTARVGDAVGPNLILDIVKGPSGLGFRCFNVPCGSSVTRSPAVLRALGGADATERYRVLGGRLGAAAWRALWPDPAGGLLARFESGDLSLENDLVLDVRRGVLTRYALLRLDENEHALRKILDDPSELARHDEHARLLRDAFAVRDALAARIGASPRPTGPSPLLLRSPSAEELAAAWRSWTAAFPDLPPVRADALKPGRLRAALDRLAADLHDVRLRLVNDKHQPGNLDPSTIETVRALGDPTLLPRAQKIVEGRRPRAILDDADPVSGLFLPPERFLDTALGAAAGLAYGPPAFAVGHLLSTTFEASLLRLAGMSAGDMGVLRRVAGELPLLAPRALKSKGRGAAGVETSEGMVVFAGADVPADSGIPDDETALPGVAWPGARAKNRTWWRRLGLVKAPPLRGYDPYHQPKAFANRVQRAQALLLEGGVAVSEGASIAADGILGPRTLLALARVATDPRFAGRADLQGVGVDMETLAAADEARFVALVETHPATVLMQWPFSARGDLSVRYYDAKFGMAVHDADILDHLFFGETPPDDLTRADRIELLKRVYGIAGRELPARAALVSVDTARPFHPFDFERVTEDAPEGRGAHAYLRFAASDSASLAEIWRVFSQQKAAEDAASHLGRRERDKAEKAAEKILHNPGLGAQGAGLFVVVFLPELSARERVLIAQPYLVEKAAREKAEDEARTAHNLAAAREHADALVKLMDDDGMFRPVRMVKFEELLRAEQADFFELVIDELRGRSPDQFERLFRVLTSIGAERALSVLVELTLPTPHGGDANVTAALEKLNVERQGLQHHRYVAGADPHVLLGGTDRLSIGQVAADVPEVENLYSRDRESEALTADAQKRFNASIEAEARLFFVDLEQGKVPPEAQTLDGCAKALMERAWKAAGLDAERDVEKVRIRESVRLYGVREAKAQKDGIRRWEVEYERVTRVEGGSSPTGWQPVAGTRQWTSDSRLEEELFWLHYAQTSKVVLLAAKVVMIGAVVVVAWEVGIISVLVSAAGGTVPVLTSIAISEAFYLLTAKEYTLEGVIGAGIQGYLGALGFRLFAPVAGAVATRLLPVGVDAAEAVTQTGFKRVVAHWLLKTGLRGALVGATVGPASLFADDLLRIGMQGGGKFSGVGAYLRSAGYGLLFGALFEIGASAVLGPIFRTSDVHSLKSADEVFQKVASKGVTLKQLAAASAEGLGAMRAWLRTILDDAIANGIYKALKERIQAAFEIAARHYTTGWKITLLRQVLELGDKPLSKQAVAGLEALLGAADGRMSNDALTSLLQKVASAGLADGWLGFLAGVDESAVAAMVKAGQLQALAAAPRALELAGARGPAEVSTMLSTRFGGSVARLEAFATELAAHGDAVQEQLLGLLRTRGTAVTPDVLLRMAKLGVPLEGDAVEGLARLMSQGARSEGMEEMLLAVESERLGPLLREAKTADADQLRFLTARVKAEAQAAKGRPVPDTWGAKEPPQVLAANDPRLVSTHLDVSPKREAFRTEVVETILTRGGAKPATDGKPTLYLMGGGGASGKGTLAEALKLEGKLPRDNVVWIDPDEIKESFIPEYKELAEMGESRAANVVHEESSALGKRALAEAQARKLDIVLDTTLGNPNKGFKLIQEARAAGYRIELYGVTVDPADAVPRALARAERTGRYVPTEELLKAHRGFSQGFEGYAAMVDEARLYDTGPKTPTVIASKAEGQALAIVDRQRYRLFQDKGTLDPHAAGPSLLHTPAPKVLPVHLAEGEYVEAAMENLRRTSRTAGGTVDTSASAGKAAQMAEGLTGEKAAELATSNFKKTMARLFRQRDTRFKSPRELRAFVERTATDVNGGITKEGMLIRTEDSPKYPYTRVADLEQAMNDFYEELFRRLDDPHQDPVALAAWVDYRIDLTDHFFADGCGKTSKAISAWTLMRARHRLPLYPAERGKIFGNAPTQVRGRSRAVDASQLEQWLTFYRTLF